MTKIEFCLSMVLTLLGSNKTTKASTYPVNVEKRYLATQLKRMAQVFFSLSARLDFSPQSYQSFSRDNTLNDSGYRNERWDDIDGAMRKYLGAAIHGHPLANLNLIYLQASGKLGAGGKIFPNTKSLLKSYEYALLNDLFSKFADNYLDRFITVITYVSSETLLSGDKRAKFLMALTYIELARIWESKIKRRDTKILKCLDDVYMAGYNTD